MFASCCYSAISWIHCCAEYCTAGVIQKCDTWHLGALFSCWPGVFLVPMSIWYLTFAWTANDKWKLPLPTVLIVAICHHRSKSEKVISTCCPSAGAQPLPEQQKSVLLPCTHSAALCEGPTPRADVQRCQGEAFRESEILGWKGMSGIIWFSLSWQNHDLGKITQHPLQVDLKSIQCWVIYHFPREIIPVDLS